ncbi:MAG: GNAT family N-acetyltransferase [Actinomycetota bacterium]
MSSAEGPAGNGESSARQATITIRVGERGDAGWLAALHTQSLPNAFLPTLGPAFMRRLYLALVKDPGGVVLVAEKDGRRVGMASGVASVPAFYKRFVWRHGLRAALAAGTRLLRPGVLRRLRESVSYPSMTSGYPDAEFLTWNVEPDGRGQGLGVRLSHEMVARLCAQGATQVKAFAYADNETLNHVFTKTGWERRGRITMHADGRESTLWVISCPSR